MKVSNSLIVKKETNSNNLSIVRSELYNNDLTSLGEYKNFNYIDIKEIDNINRKMVIYNLPNVNEDELKQFFITLLNQLTNNNNKLLSNIISFDKRDNGEYYIIELSKHEYCQLLKKFDGIEWMNYNIKIAYPREFIDVYNLTFGKVALKSKINESFLLKNIIKNKDNSNKVYQRMYMSGFSKDTKEGDIRKLLENYGNLRYFTFFGNYHNDNNGYCFFEYEDDEDRLNAIKLLNGYIFNGSKLKLNKANVKASNDNQVSNNQGYDKNDNFKIARKIMKDNMEGKEELNNKINSSTFSSSPSFSFLFPPKIFSVPSRVILFLNAISAEDLGEASSASEVTEDFRAISQKYGAVLGVYVPRPGAGGVCSPAVGRIFVKFAGKNEAKRARKEINGLRYGARMIIGVFYPEEEYDGGNVNIGAE